MNDRALPAQRDPMDAAVRECIVERRPVSVLPVRKYRPAGSGDPFWERVDERAERLAVRRDTSQ